MKPEKKEQLKREKLIQQSKLHDFKVMKTRLADNTQIIVDKMNELATVAGKVKATEILVKIQDEANTDTGKGQEYAIKRLNEEIAKFNS